MCERDTFKKSNVDSCALFDHVIEVVEMNVGWVGSVDIIILSMCSRSNIRILYTSTKYIQKINLIVIN